MSAAEHGHGLIDGVPTYTPGSDGYKRATSPRNSSARQRPALVATPASAEGVAAALRYAAGQHLRVVPQATGHGAAGELGSDVLLLDTSALTAIEINVAGRTAKVGAGAQWGAINGEAEKSGLLGRAGSAADVGVSGYTFGGGAGWLIRPYGLAAGALIAVDFVDGRGRVRRAADDATDEADRDALWAYRGGGGVGIAVSLEFELVPIDDLWAGSMVWPVQELEAVVEAWVRTIPQFGAGLATSLGVLRVPPGPPIPGTQPGQQIVHLAMASSTGEPDAQPLRDALPAALVDTWGPADAAKLSEIHMDPPVAVASLGMARWLTESAASIAVDILAVAVESPILMMELRHVTNAAPARDGAASRVAGDFMLHAVGDAADDDGVAHLEAAFSSVRRAATAADCGRAIGSWADGRQSVPDALPQDVRDRVIATRHGVDPDDLIAVSRLIDGGQAVPE